MDTDTALFVKGRYPCAFRIPVKSHTPRWVYVKGRSSNSRVACFHHLDPMGDDTGAEPLNTLHHDLNAWLKFFQVLSCKDFEDPSVAARERFIHCKAPLEYAYPQIGSPNSSCDCPSCLAPTHARRTNANQTLFTVLR